MTRAILGVVRAGPLMLDRVALLRQGGGSDGPGRHQQARCALVL